MNPETELFITKGLLPENLPPVFTSAKLWPAFSAFGSSYSVTRPVVGEHAIYNASKRGGQRRIFRVPHPAFVRDQGLFIEKHWATLSSLFARSTGSLSRPEFFRHGPRHVRITSHADLPAHRLRNFSRFSYCLITDVSRFFPSIYTHTLPWAIHGKAAAKRDTTAQSASVYGNRLDLVLRQSQSRQTIGIAVGPDTSKVVAEILMSAVDADFISRSGAHAPTFIRHVDDYWIGGNSVEECERHLSNLRTSLREYELDINESKTKIISAKYVFSDDWPIDFEAELDRQLEPFAPVRRLLPLLSGIVEIATQKNDDGIIRRVIRKIDERQAWGIDWENLEHFLAHCALQFPHSLDYVSRVVSWRHRIYHDVDLVLWNHVAHSSLRSRGAAGYDSECVWALWLIKEIGGSVPKAVSTILLETCGPLVLAFMAHMGGRGLLEDRQWRSKLIGLVEGDPLSGPYWPLTLELTHLRKGDRRWLSGSSIPPVIIALHAQRKSIIDWDALPKVFGDADGIPHDVPEKALEDYGDDYGQFHDDDEEQVDDEGDEPFGDGAGFLAELMRSTIGDG